MPDAAALTERMAEMARRRAPHVLATVVETEGIAEIVMQRRGGSGVPRDAAPVAALMDAAA